MKTYEDLLAVGEDDIARGEFCKRAVDEFRQSKEYVDAVIGEAYYNKHNITIENFRKWLYTMSGRKVEDVYSANYKLSTLFFRRMVIQQTSFLLGNGVTLSNPENKKKLGKDFDYQVQKAAKLAMSGGRSFGFWNNDHVEVFGYADTEKHAGFRPLYSTRDAEMRAGIRFWSKSVGNSKITRYTLYEPEGITEFVLTVDGKIELLEPRVAYRVAKTTTAAEGVISAVDANYAEGLPIVPLYASDTYESELVGVRASIDAYDLTKSGLCNNIDDFNEVYWLIKNSGGMDDTDIAKMIQRLKQAHGAVVDADDGGDITPYTVDVPFEAREKALEILRNDIYEDMMLLDIKSLSGAQKTAQEIQAAYQPQDNKTDDFEYYVRNFLDRILALAGINDEVTLIRSKVSNMPEQSNMVLAASNYVSPECIIKHLPWLTPEEADDEIAKYQNAEMDQFRGKEEPEAPEENEVE